MLGADQESSYSLIVPKVIQKRVFWGQNFLYGNSARTWLKFDRPLYAQATKSKEIICPRVH